MSTREPMWFCHQCRSEMHPLMAPDPTCASCHGSFVEKIEDLSDDPRDFIAPANPRDMVMGGLDGLDPFLMSLQTFFSRGFHQASSTGQRSQSAPGLIFQVRSTSGPRPTSVMMGTSSPPTGPPGSPPTMSEFLRSTDPSNNHRDRNPNTNSSNISGPLFMQYLVSLLGQANQPFTSMFMDGMPDSGRMGDYVFTQEALDQIMTQIMENSNSHRPVPATEEIIQKLPRHVLEETSPLLSKDCAVCKDQFQLSTEDPDEQIVVQLPCKHSFHQPCILPWLKSSGTCPVCRYALVPQPDHNAPRNNATSTSTSSPLGAGGSPFNYSSSPSSAPRARSQSPPFGHRSTRLDRGSTSELHRNNPGIRGFTQFFRNLAGPHGSFETPSNPTPSSVSLSMPLPTSPPCEPASESLGTQGPSRRHMHRSSLDSSVPFIPRSSTSRSQSQSSRYQLRDQNSSGGSGDGSGTQGQRPHVPGEWSDDLTDLD